MIQNSDIELIEKHLAGNLTEKEKKDFDEKNKSDKEFSKEVTFREDLKVAGERVVSAEFKAMFHNIHTDSVNKKKRAKKFYLYSTIVVSAAAIAILFFFIGNPLGENRKIESYIAKAGGITTLSIPNISYLKFKSPEEAGHHSFGELQVAFIRNDDYCNKHDRYFFKREVLYLFKQPDDTTNFFYKLEGNGKRIYYLCRNKQLFSLKDIKENRLFDLQPVNDIDLKNYCR